MRPLGDEVDLAELNHLITHDQLRLLGLSARQIRYRVATDALHPVIPGVYSTESDTGDFLVRMAALCLRYPEGFMSGAAAARYWRLRRGVPDYFEFTVPDTRRPAGVDFAQFRYATGIHQADVFVANDGIRVSSPARTVFECAGRLDEFGLRSMVTDGIRDRKVTKEALAEVGKRLCVRGRRGTRLFRHVMALADITVPVDSEDEMLLLDALRSANLDGLVAQYEVKLPRGGSAFIDAAIPELRLGYEVDGPTHDDPISVHADKSRDLQLSIVGWHINRIPADEIRRRPRVVAAMAVAIARERRLLFATR